MRQCAPMSDDAERHRGQKPWVRFLTNVFTAAAQAGALAIPLVLATFVEPVGAWLTSRAIVALVLVVLFLRLRYLLDKANHAPDDEWKMPHIRPTLVAAVTTAGAAVGSAIGEWMGGPVSTMVAGRTESVGPRVYLPVVGLAVAAYLGAKLSQRGRR